MAAQLKKLFLIISIYFHLCQLIERTCTEFIESKYQWTVTVTMLQGWLWNKFCFDIFTILATTCGGNVIGDSGIIRYNHSGYGDNSGCMWLIRSNINSEIEVRLLEDTFSSSSQYIGIYQLFLDGEIAGNGGSYMWVATWVDNEKFIRNCENKLFFPVAMETLLHDNSEVP